MIKNCLLILLMAGLFSCNQSTSKQTAADTAKTGVADTSLTDNAIVKDSAADKLIASDTATANPVPADRLISPGKGIGHIMVDDDAAQSIKLLGKPDSADAAMGSSLMVWFANHNAKGYRTSVFSRRNMGGKDENISHIQKILVSSPWFKTADHLGVGSAVEFIKKSYLLKPFTTYKANGHTVQVYTDADKGISFEVDNTTQKCVVVVVHKAHDTAATYINMH